MKISQRILAAAFAVIGVSAPTLAQTPAAALWPASRSPVESDAGRWLAQGKSLYEAGEFKEAAAAFERALQLRVVRPHDAALGVARSYARLDNRKQSFRWIEHALELGLPDSRLLFEEPAFGRYRRDAEFRSLASPNGRREGMPRRSVLLNF